MKKSLLLATLVVCSFMSVYAQTIKPTNLITPVGPIGIGTLEPKQSIDIKSGTIRIENYARTPAGDVNAAIAGRIAVFNTLGDVVAGPECIGCIGTPIPTLGFWDINGNDSVKYGTHFLGTKNNQYLDIRSDNSTRLLLTTGANPTAVFKVPVKGSSLTLSDELIGTKINLSDAFIGTSAVLSSNLSVSGAATIGAELSSSGLTVSNNTGKGLVVETPQSFDYGYNTRLIMSNTKTKALAVQLKQGTTSTETFVLYADGRMGIGTTQMGSCKLAVEGVIGARGIKVLPTNASNSFPDYVFDKEYHLLSLSELEEYITKNKHLPNIPSAQEVAKSEGIELGEMNRLLLEKIEEQTLYILQLQKRLEVIETKVNR